MPIGSVLALPCEVTEEDLERVETRRLRNYETPEESVINAFKEDTLLSKQTMLRVKCCELISTIVTIILFIYEKSISQCVNVDLLTSSFFGALLMYPLMILSIPKHNDLSTVMMIMNLICSLLLFTNGYFTFSSWYELKNYILADAISSSDPITSVATFKYLGAVFSFIIGTVYGTETFIQLIDNVKTILR